MPQRILRLALVVGLLLPGLAADGFAASASAARTQSFRLQSEGMRLYREGKYPEAIEAFRKVVNMHLNSFMAWYYLGASLVAERRYGEAVEPLKIALDLQPDYVQAHLLLGDAYLKHGETEEARAEYLRALDLQPNYAAAHDGLGRLLESLGKDEEAEAAYRKALEINVAYADSYTHLGELYLRKGRLGEATALFLKAIAMKPDFSQAYTRLGVALSRQNRFDDAIAAARKSQSLAPRDPEPHVALARIYIDLQSFDRAREAVAAALAIDAQHVWVSLIQADLRRAEGDLALASSGLQERFDRGIDDPRMKRLTAEALRRLRTDAEQLAILTTAANANPEATEPAVDLARFHAQQKSHLKAADILKTAAARSAAPGGDPALRFESATEYLAARHQAQAIALLEGLAADESASRELRADALFNLGVARADAGLDDDAVVSFRGYLALHPDDPRALLYLGNALLRLGRRDEARTAYATCAEKSAPGAEVEHAKRLVQSLQPAVAAKP